MKNEKAGIYLDKNGKYNVDKSFNKIRIRKKGFLSEIDAMMYYDNEVKKIIENQNIENNITYKAISLQGLFEEFLKLYANRTDKTKRNIRQIFNQYIYIDWNNVSLKTDEDFVTLFTLIINRVNERGVSRKQGNVAIGLLNKMIDFGKDRNYVRRSVSRHKEMSFKVVNTAVSIKTEENYLLVGQYEQLMEALSFFEGNEELFPSAMMDWHDFELFCLILGHIGLRIGEMRGICFKDIMLTSSFDKPIYKLVIDKQFSDECKEITNSTKTGVCRTPVIPDFLIEKINNHKAKYNFNDEDFIFNTRFNYRKNEGRSILGKTFREILKKTILKLKEHGILPPSFNHDISCNALRRTAEDYLGHVDKVDSKTASNVMGHSKEIAYMHYKKQQLEDELVIASRSQQTSKEPKEEAKEAPKETVGQKDITIETKSEPKNDNLAIKNTINSSDDIFENIVSLVQRLVIDHMTGKISDEKFNTIKVIINKLLS